MDGTVPQTGFLPGRNRQNAEKQLPGRASASGLAGKRGFFANLPANRGFGRGRCDMAAFGGRFVLHVLATDPVEHREAILRKKGRLNAKSCVFSTIICKGGFPLLRYVSAGAAATFFAAFVPWPVFCFAKLHCLATASFS